MAARNWLFCWFSGRIPYSEMDQELPLVSLPTRVIRAHKFVKACAQLQVFAGLVCLALGALSDYINIHDNSGKPPLIVECCGLYLIVAGFVGICGASSFRRGLVTAFLVMCIHAALILVPAIIASSAKAISDSNLDCYVSCERSVCQVFCGDDEIKNLPKRSLKPIRADLRLEIGLISIAVLELLLSLVSGVLSARALCEGCGVVDQAVISQVHKVTTMRTPVHSVDIATVSSEISPISEQ